MVQARIPFDMRDDTDVLRSGKGWIWENAAGIAAFSFFILLGVFTGAAVYREAFAEPMKTYLDCAALAAGSAMPPQNVLPAVLLGPALFTAVMLLCGFQRWTLPLWGIGCVCFGTGVGMRFAGAAQLFDAGIRAAGLCAAAPAALLFPAYAYMACRPVVRLRRGAKGQADNAGAFIAGALPILTVILSVESVLAALSARLWLAAVH